MFISSTDLYFSTKTDPWIADVGRFLARWCFKLELNIILIYWMDIKAHGKISKPAPNFSIQPKTMRGTEEKKLPRMQWVWNANPEDPTATWSEMNTFDSKPNTRTRMKMPENGNSGGPDTWWDKTTTFGLLKKCSTQKMFRLQATPRSSPGLLVAI